MEASAHDLLKDDGLIYFSVRLMQEVLLFDEKFAREVVLS